MLLFILYCPGQPAWKRMTQSHVDSAAVEKPGSTTWVEFVVLVIFMKSSEMRDEVNYEMIHSLR